MTDITVVVADDHPVYRGGLRAALADVPGVVVVAEAATGADAVTAAVEHQADVVLMDLSMPGGTGIEATTELRRRRPETAVLALTMHEDPVTVAAAVTAGARGYLVKGAGQDDIVRAIRTVAAGDLLLAGPVADHLLEGLGTPAVV
ncbi:MAG TPA: response regulator transcription factor, partial [Nakamurella sp.]